MNKINLTWHDLYIKYMKLKRQYLIHCQTLLKHGIEHDNLSIKQNESKLKLIDELLTLETINKLTDGNANETRK